MDICSHPRRAMTRAESVAGATQIARLTPLSRRIALTVLLCVIVLHIGLYAMLRGSSGWQPQQVARAPGASVTLRLLPRREPIERHARVEANATPRPQTPRRDMPAEIARPTRSAITPSASLPVAAQAEAAPLPALPASTPPSPLDLTLPRGFAARPAPRNPALDDPRANSARPDSPEARIAAGFDTRLIEDELGEGRRRLRRGANCVIVTPSRVGQLMPFDDAAARTPSMVSTCP